MLCDLGLFGSARGPRLRARGCRTCEARFRRPGRPPPRLEVGGARRALTAPRTWPVRCARKILPLSMLNSESQGGGLAVPGSPEKDEESKTRVA